MKKTRLVRTLLALLLALSILVPGMVYAGDPEQTEEVMSGEVLPEPAETEEETAPPEQEPAAAVTEEPEKAETAVPEEKAVPEKEETPVSREEPAPAVNDQPLPEEPAVQEEEPEQPGEPEKEAGEDSPEMPAGPDETPAEIPESAQPEEPESVSGAEDASAGEPAVFESGYVLVRKQTKVYAGTNTQTVRGTFPEGGVAWAVRATDNEDPRKAWLKISFDTAEAREAGDLPLSGYIREADATPLTEQETGRLLLQLEADPQTRTAGSCKLPLVMFRPEKPAEEPVEAGKEEKPEEKPGKLASNDAGDAAGELTVSLPATVKKGIGTAVVLTAAVSGGSAGGEMEFSWELSTDAGATWRQIPGTEEGFSVTDGGRKLAFTLTDLFYDRNRIRCKARGEAAGEAWTVSNETVFVRPFTAKVTVSPAKAAIGTKVTYTVTPSTTGNLTYQWQLSTNQGKTWKNMKNKTAKTLTRTVKDFEYDYRYRCLVTKTNSKGATAQIDSNVSYAKKKYTVKATCSDPAPGTGTIVTMNAAVSGAGGTLTYQWQYSTDKGKTWTAATNSGNKTAEMSVKIRETTFGTYYRCLVKASSSGEVNSNSLVISQPHTPVIDYQDEYSAGIGEWLEMSAATDREGVLEYVWQVSTDKGTTWTALADDGTVTNSRGAVLAVLVDPDGERYTYQYRCRVAVDGKIVYSNALSIRKPVSVSITPSPAAVGIGAAQTLQAAVGSGFTGSAYRWQISSDNGLTWTDYGTDTASDSLSVSVPEELAAQYYSVYRIRCLVTAGNGLRTVTVNTAAVAFEPPYTVTVTAAPQDGKAGIGKKVKFVVTTDGASDETYQWQVSTDKGATWSDIQDKTGKTLYIQVTTENFDYDANRYRCKVTDPGKGIVYSDGKASIKRPYSVKLSAASAVLAEGKTQAFTVTVSGSATYEWQYSDNAGASWTAATGDSGYKTKTVTLKGDEAHFQRLYRCKVTVNSVSTYSGLVYIDPLAAQYYTFKPHGQYWDVAEYSGTSATLKVPAGYHGRKVVRIDNETFKGKTKIKKVTIPKSVTAIGASAFEGCTALATVVLSDNIKAIGKAAFKNCSSLANMEISNK